MTRRVRYWFWSLVLDAIASRWAFSRPYYWALAKFSGACDWGPPLPDDEGEPPW